MTIINRFTAVANHPQDIRKKKLQLKRIRKNRSAT